MVLGAEGQKNCGPSQESVSEGENLKEKVRGIFGGLNTTGKRSGFTSLHFV